MFLKIEFINLSRSISCFVKFLTMFTLIFGFSIQDLPSMGFWKIDFLQLLLFDANMTGPSSICFTKIDFIIFLYFYSFLHCTYVQCLSNAFKIPI